MIVRKLRLQRGWSQDQLARLTDLSVRTIQRIERGHTPSLESAKALASVLEVDLATFMTEDTDMQHDRDIRQEKAALDAEEIDALRYARRVKGFYEGLAAYAILAIVFLGVFNRGEPVVYWVFLGVGAGLLLQGLIAFEVLRLDLPNWERRLVEKRLGRKL